MAHLGRSSIPLDLMTYSGEDQQPSLFLLKENDRQTLLTLFNWTEQTRTHRIALADLGLVAHHDYRVTNVLESGSPDETVTDTVNVTQPAHSVRVLKMVDPSIPLHPPATKMQVSSNATAGESLAFIAEPLTAEDAIVQYNWDFGDGVSVEARTATHAYTHEGSFPVKLTTIGVDGATGVSTRLITVTGAVSTKYHPDAKRRFE